MKTLSWFTRARLSPPHAFLFLFLLVSTLSIATAQAARVEAPDSLAPGPFAVATSEYKLPAAIDPEVLKTDAVELWARVFWPKDLSRPRPLLLFLHGNHPTCGTGSAPRLDSNCEYTFQGTCPSDMSVVPNHEGYNYVAEHLATYGYVVVSINANRGITCGNGDEVDSGLNLARGRLILRHLESWMKWTTEGGVPESLSSIAAAETAFKGAIDFKNVGLMGHSRGGEGVRAAYNLYSDPDSPWPARIPGLQIKGIYEIGAVDGQTSRTLDADGTAWNQLLPMCDGDVYDLQGRMPFERMIVKKSEAHKAPKSLTMAWGTNHNFFNTEWQESDSHGCTGHEPIYGNGWASEAQQKIAIASLTAFFRAHVGDDHDERFTGQFDSLAILPSSLTSVTHIDRAFVPTPDELYNVRVEEFDQPTGINSQSRLANEAVGIEISHDSTDLPNRGDIRWSTAGPDRYFQINWRTQDSQNPLQRQATLDFRVAREEGEANGTEPTDFSVALVDTNGQVSSLVPVSRYAEILGPANETATFQTVRIPLADFGLASDAQVQGLRFVFDRTPTGAISIANVRFASKWPFEVVAKNQAPQTQAPSENAPRTEKVQDQPLPASAYRSHSSINLRSRRKAKLRLSAEVIEVRRAAQSRFFSNRSAVEIEIQAKAGGFPVSAELPTLVLNDKQFSSSRIKRSGQLDVLVFSVPVEDLKKLPRSGSMHIQYGAGEATKIWQLPDYDRQKILSAK